MGAAGEAAAFADAAAAVAAVAAVAAARAGPAAASPPATTPATARAPISFRTYSPFVTLPEGESFECDKLGKFCAFHPNCLKILAEDLPNCNDLRSQERMPLVRLNGGHQRDHLAC
jgi:hypothetical protein